MAQVGVLIGSTPDLSFLPPSVRKVLDAAGTPPDTYDGVRATHPVFVDVEPFSMEVRVISKWEGLQRGGTRA